jgi:hypothetical protein
MARVSYLALVFILVAGTLYATTCELQCDLEMMGHGSAPATTTQHHYHSMQKSAGSEQTIQDADDCGGHSMVEMFSLSERTSRFPAAASPTAAGTNATGAAPSPSQMNVHVAINAPPVSPPLLPILRV